jgi:hypothetical protein
MGPCICVVFDYAGWYNAQSGRRMQSASQRRRGLENPLKCIKCVMMFFEASCRTLVSPLLSVFQYIRHISILKAQNSL